MKKIALISITILMLAGMLAAQGKDYPQLQRNPNCYGPGRNAKLAPRPEWDGTSMDMLKELNLSEAQTKKLSDLQISQRKAMNSINAEIENLQIDLNNSLKSKDFSSARKLNDQLHEKMRVKANTRIDHREQILRELSPEQQEKFRPMFMERQYGRPNGSKHPMPCKLNELKPVQLHRHQRNMMNQDCCGCEDCHNKTEK
ncbi:MAG TPA: Spy/CpxP family protein refolding chaperone [Candidatus Syntrophosphaera sp.]|nr:Spy/CpxP family protein refolding chaperone [Candidatus Cloacimonadota bacterium]OQB89943.1 MAG: periplasmic protein [Candidatus Cloacimonetes bacterium ADurb.Bin117]HRQ67665.1 Spy/CpxP family protein refolding chaperone [Candidatus Syntrophosphaera sp.]HRT59904.1 Spy/CpxP family protein refolding chaperone [Candidatus Syntrophosphaera sp.]